MPLLSREVVTLRLILDCDEEEGLDESQDVHKGLLAFKNTAVGLLDLPTEIHAQILEYLLLFDLNRRSHTQRIAPGSIDHLLGIHSRRILEAPQFRHKSKQEINGVLPQYYTCTLHMAPLLVCKTLYRVAASILYRKNQFIAVHCGLRGLAGRLKNYGIPTYGPINANRLVLAPKKGVRPPSAGRSSNGHDNDPHLDADLNKFEPSLIIQGKKSSNKVPFFVCSRDDGFKLLHALWIMVKSPFARDMRFNILITGDPCWRKQRVADDLVRRGAIPWLTEFIDSININVTTPNVLAQKRIDDLIGSMLILYPENTNVNGYIAICMSLEQRLAGADKDIVRRHYCEAEAVYERICYEACSVVRTRTAKLVDVSKKMPDGINRICKLIAISAFRLCELRSGAVVVFPNLRKASSIQASQESTLSRTSSVDLGERVQRQDLDIPAKSMKTRAYTIKEQAPAGRVSQSVRTSTTVRTTRLEGAEAVDNAIVSGLLAFRLPCASPLAEWNIRLNEMLLTVFEQRGDHDNALVCIRRLQQNFGVVLKDYRARGRKSKVELLEALVKDLNEAGSLAAEDDSWKRTKGYHLALTHSHEVVRRLWDERLTPKSDYTGLIWTFRWA